MQWDSNAVCSICGFKGCVVLEAPEMMFGTREKFTYHFCQMCESIVLQTKIADWAKYYTSDYNFYSPIQEGGLFRRIYHYLAEQRIRYCVTGKGYLGRFLNQLKPHSHQKIWKALAIPEGSSVLDVGCAHGAIIYPLRNMGFKALGIDPNIESDINYSNGLKILKTDLDHLKNKISEGTNAGPQGFDLIMFHHSFEHFENPEQQLRQAVGLLNKGGRILIRIPLASSYAWKHYEQNWVQLDPPRHTHLFSEKSLGILCERTGLKIVSAIFDSTAFQFWGSEQYVKDIPLKSPKSHLVDTQNSIFTKSQIEFYEKATTIFNQLNLGDQAAFIIEKSP